MLRPRHERPSAYTKYGTEVLVVLDATCLSWVTRRRRRSRHGRHWCRSGPSNALRAVGRSMLVLRELVAVTPDPEAIKKCERPFQLFLRINSTACACIPGCAFSAALVRFSSWSSAAKANITCFVIQERSTAVDSDTIPRKLKCTLDSASCLNVMAATQKRKILAPRVGTSA